ncbi:MAG: hypothetical protein ACR2PA_23370 [Hyphomicrobiaceae bacterium]
MHWGSRAFVFIVFVTLACSFWATTAMLYLEFADPPNDLPVNDALWFALLTHYSDLFIFFPLFGTVALFAFYTPACAFVDMYWHISRQQDEPIPNSRIRFVFWFLVLSAFSYSVAYKIEQSSERSLWQLQPAVLKADKGELCDENQCGRVSFIDGLKNIRRLSRVRTKITDLARVCQKDNFISPPTTPPPERYCAATTNFMGRGGDLQNRWQSDEICCLSQVKFDDTVKVRHGESGSSSETDALQKHLWPLNIFFLHILLAISVLLALRRARIERYYAAFARQIDSGVIVGVLAMAFLVVMNRGFLESTQLLHGATGAASFHRGPDTFMVIFALWALLILFSFVHPANKQAELTSRLLGIAFSVLFVFNAETITNFGVRYLGAGAGIRSVGALCAIALVMIVLVIALPRIKLSGNDEDADDGDSPAATAGRIPDRPR